MPPMDQNADTKKGRKLESLILDALRSTPKNCRQITHEIEPAAQNAGIACSPGTVRNKLIELVESGKITHRNQGYLVEKKWKDGQPKAFVLVQILKPSKQKENFPKKFVDDVDASFNNGEHPGLNLIGADVVLGAEFSAIVQVYSDDLHCIGSFVKEWILGHPLVTNTQTIMVWPKYPK